MPRFLRSLFSSCSLIWAFARFISWYRPASLSQPEILFSTAYFQLLAASKA